MKKRLIGGHFSSVPLVELLLATADIEPEDEVRDEPPPEGGAQG